MKNLTYCLILFFTTDLLWSQQATLHPTTFTSQGVLRDAQGRSLEAFSSMIDAELKKIKK